MSKKKPCSSFALEGSSARPSREQPGASKLAARRRPALEEIGFVGLGRMGTAMAANLAAAGGG